METWDDIINLVDRNEIDKILEIYKKMEESKYVVFRDKLINELQRTENRRHRNTIAIVLGDLKCNESVGVMVELINKPENRMCIGTLIYALEELDCEHEIKNIIHVLFDGNYEAQCNMYSLLEQKVNGMSREDKCACLDIVKQKREKLEEELDFVSDVEVMLEAL